ncbi:uncharacterized protein LOC111238244 isoform X2 [Seriola dumerili]|uniref:uncharacterized protein LOC111238244 isoform X2 n=1 Tax=Seriola dumerili TaxID=41447 RepID=UPI000BBE8F19|nr:uncharacterized protein LOC111238244 isoform X2 [Seriola dumerili]
MRRLHGAFTAQLLLVCAVSAVIVPSPTNVTLSCQNLKTTVRWEYSEQQPQTSFEVLIISSEGRQKNETTDHQYDLSPFIWESEQRYEGYYSVNVTAVQGGRKSAPAKSQSLSFNEVKPAHVKCELDFPPVSLTEGGSGATVSFYNPVHFYKELQTATKQNNVVFRFTVLNITGKLGTADCRLENTICRYDFSFPEGVDECVSLDGELFDRNFINSVKFRQTSPVCVTESAEVHMVTLTILLCVFIIIIILAAIAIYKVRAYLNEKSIHPTFLKFIPSDKRYVFKTNEENISPLVVEDNSYSSEEEGGTPEDHRGGGGCGGGGRSNGSDQLTAGYGGGDLLEDSSQEPDTADEDSADDSVKTECVMIEEEEEEEWEVRVGAYDCAHNIPDTGDEQVNVVYTQR